MFGIGIFDGDIHYFHVTYAARIIAQIRKGEYVQVEWGAYSFIIHCLY